MSTLILDLIDAIKNEDFDSVREYLTNGDGELDINKVFGSNKRTPLHYSVEQQYRHRDYGITVGKGCQHGNKGDIYGSTTLMDAAKSQKSVETLQYLLKHGANANKCNFLKPTALHIMHVEIQNVVAVRSLLEHGADVHARDECGKTPLQTAAGACGQENDTTCLQVLLDHGADILTRDYHCRTLLHNAIRHAGFTRLANGSRCARPHGQTTFVMDMFSFLLDKKKIDLNATDRDGDTVLHYCVMQNRFSRARLFHVALKNKALHETVSLLLAHLDLQGIDRHSMLSMIDDNGYTALQYTRNKEGAQSLLEQLTNNGEDVLPCCRDLLFVKNGQGRTLSQKLQAYLDGRDLMYDFEKDLLLLEYLHSFTENSLSVPESTEHGTSAVAVCINPLLNDFQRVLANQMLRMSLTCPGVSTNVTDEMPESIKVVTMGYLTSADVMKRNPKMVKTGVLDDDENSNHNEFQDDIVTASRKKWRNE